MTSARAELHVILAPLLPDDWRVLDYTPTPSTVARTELWMKQSRVAKNPAKKRGLDDTTITLSLVSPIQAPPKADDAIDERLDILLDALDRLTGVIREPAERVTIDDSYPGYVVPVVILTNRKDTP